MARFQYRKAPHTYRKIVLSVCAFTLIRNITYCYAVEGSYPESLDYLKEHYGLTYDEDRFFVDYQVIGANILPDVTIIEKGEP